tara:strand:- start:653 stop:967 length:315 start_codon:yes stop_codon:yes gene_type:complete
MRYYLITDHNRDGEHEYFDKVLVKTEMSIEEIDGLEWEKYFLAWQFGYIYLDDDDWWSNCRIVRIDSCNEVSKEDAIVLDKHLGSNSLEQIILDGKETFEEYRA